MGMLRVLTAIAVAQCQWAHSCTPWNEDGNAVVSLNGQSIASNTDATKVVGPDVKQKTKELCLCMRMTFVCMSFPITDGLLLLLLLLLPWLSVSGAKWHFDPVVEVR